MFFFFFFKQKTAYEMRISDWSSDVCSSDLSAALHQLNDWVDTGEPPPSQPRLVRQNDGHLQRDEQGFVEGGVRMPNYAVPVGLNRGDTCTLLGSCKPFSAAAVRSRYASSASYHRQFRSAEPKSELQSLMRLPY